MGMESVTLTKPWLTFAAGDTVKVDPLRALWLRENGYGTYKGTVVKPPRVGPGDHGLRPTEPELQSPFPGVEIQPEILPLAITETQIADMGDGPEMVDRMLAQDEAPEGHIVSRGRRARLIEDLDKPLALDVKDVKEP